MLTLEKLFQRIDHVGAWSELARTLGVSLSVEQFRQTIGEHDLRRAFGAASVESEALRTMLHAYPIPDWQRMGEYSDFSLLYHLDSGLTDAIRIAETIDRHLLKINQGEGRLNVLDFGAGLGRVLRYLVQFVPEHNFYASEVNPLAFEWGRNTFTSAIYTQSQSAPPLSMQSALLDVAYAWSIFSHYSEELHLKWLEELSRVIKPGGLLILTVQGRILIDRIAAEENVRIVMRLWDRNLWANVSKQFDSYGYTFYECYKGDAKADSLGIDPATFGMSFISEDYIKEKWSKYFALLEYLPGRISNWQDFIVLRRI